MIKSQNKQSFSIGRYVLVGKLFVCDIDISDMISLQYCCWSKEVAPLELLTHWTVQNL